MMDSNFTVCHAIMLLFRRLGPHLKKGIYELSNDLIYKSNIEKIVEFTSLFHGETPEQKQNLARNLVPYR